MRGSLLRLITVVASAVFLSSPKAQRSVDGQSLTPRQPGFYYRTGGLPVLFPPRPHIDCSQFTDCYDCTNEASCSFCYSSYYVDSLSGATKVTGSCSNFGDARATAKCPDANRFYIPGQCVIPFTPGCIIHQDGTCQIEHIYNDSTANMTNLRFAFGWFIAVCTILALVIAMFILNNRLAPYYGKSPNMSMPDLPPKLGALFIVIVLEIAALANNEYSAANQPDLWYSFGLFGRYTTSKLHPTSYTCSDTNVGANLTYCRVLPAASALTFILSLIGGLAALGRFLSQWYATSGNWFDRNLSTKDIHLWRIDLIGCVCSCGAALLWTSAHVIISETMITPSTGGPHDSLHIRQSWVLQICCAILYTYACVVYAIEINTTTPPEKTPEDLELARKFQQDLDEVISAHERGENPTQADIEKISVDMEKLQQLEEGADGAGGGNGEGGMKIDGVEIAAAEEKDPEEARTHVRVHVSPTHFAFDDVVKPTPLVSNLSPVAEQASSSPDAAHSPAAGETPHKSKRQLKKEAKIHAHELAETEEARRKNDAIVTSTTITTTARHNDDDISPIQRARDRSTLAEGKRIAEEQMKALALATEGTTVASSSDASQVQPSPGDPSPSNVYLSEQPYVQPPVIDPSVADPPVDPAVVLAAYQADPAFQAAAAASASFPPISPSPPDAAVDPALAFENLVPPEEQVILNEAALPPPISADNASDQERPPPAYESDSDGEANDEHEVVL